MTALAVHTHACACPETGSALTFERVIADEMRVLRRDVVSNVVRAVPQWMSVVRIERGVTCVYVYV